MNPREYYRLKISQITEEDIKRVASCMTDYIGEENAVRIETLAGRVGMHERQVRDILETLVCVYHWPIGAHAGIAGRWIIDNEIERWQVLGDLESRIQSLRKRREALLMAKIPKALELNKAEASILQNELF